MLMAADRTRIKDIAMIAGVSVGTVDRVLHNRPNVSKKAREKVENALKEMDYSPNVYASALAYNKEYSFQLIMPQHESEAYWQEIEEGALAAIDRRRDFHIGIEIKYYERQDPESFSKTTEESIGQKPDAVVVVPTTLEATKTFTDLLHAMDTPFILLDSYMPDLRPLSFFGQDSFNSGVFAAKMLMLVAAGETEVMIMKQTREGMLYSKQQENRERGFRQYMIEHFPGVGISELDLPLERHRGEYDKLLDSFFVTHPEVHHCITFNSKAHIVGEYLQRTNRRDIQIMGYDMVPKNAECMRNGSISFLIAQHAYMQGFSCVESLFRAMVLKKEVPPVNYMPIELLSKENVDFYRRMQL